MKLLAHTSPVPSPLGFKSGKLHGFAAHTLKRLALGGLGLLGLLSSAPQASAIFLVVDNFESYTVGTDINGQGNWQANTVGGTQISTVAANPSGSGKVLSMATTAAGPVANSNYAINTSPLINIANNTSGTLFYQFYFASTNALNISHGLSDVTTPGSNDFAAFEVQMRNGNNAGNAALPAEFNNMYVRDASAFEGLTSGAASPTGSSPELTQGHWYSIWLVANNTADTFQVYLQSSTDANYATQTQLFSSGLDDLNFRSGTTLALSSFYAITGGGTEQSLFFDNLYIDSGAVNLANPVPETNAALLILGGLAYLVLRRPRRH